jgi:plasmid maintenance system antidote protein VapI
MTWGRDGVGEGHSQAKLSDREVAQLREMYALGHWSQRDLAALFRVSQPQVSAILANKARVA